ncbi:MAG TPA: protein kinase [Planktothrix sp.]
MTVTIRSNRPISIGGDSSLPPLAPKLREHFELLDKIGEGGMGTVYRVRERVTGKQFALKVLNPDGSDDIRALQRFEQEAQSVRRLSHHNLVSILDHGAPLEYAPYILMEFVEGNSLASIINREGSLSEKRAIDITRQVCAALEHAHAKGIVHRDLKPSNIIVADDGTVKVVDFGIAKMMSTRSKSSELTEADELTGSPFYMSPEQCACDELDARSDIYSLGCVLFEMVVGSPPFTNRNPVKVILSHITEHPRDICKAFSHVRVSPEYNTIVSKCLQKRTQDRYQSAAALRQDLELVGSGRKPFAASDAKRKLFLMMAMVACSLMVIVYVGVQLVNKFQIAQSPTASAADVTTKEKKRMESAVQSALAGGDSGASITDVIQGSEDVHKDVQTSTETIDGRRVTAVNASYVRAANRQTDPDLANVQFGAFVLNNPNITGLTIEDGYMNDSGYTIIPQTLKKLRSLVISTSAITSQGLAPFVKIPGLRQFVLFHDRRVFDECMNYIKQMPIRKLALGYAQITDSVAPDIVTMKSVKVLSLEGTNVTDVGARMIVDGMPQLTDLNLGNLRITDDVLAHIRRAKNLKTLSLANDRFISAGISQLGDTNLEDINLDGTGVRDADLIALARCPKLVHLSLNQTALTDKGLQTLEGMKHLRSIAISDTPAISASAVNMLAHRRPDFGIRRVAEKEGALRGVMSEIGTGRF